MVVRETVIGELEVIGHSFEEETQNAVGEFTFLIFILYETMNNMHLEIK